MASMPQTTVTAPRATRVHVREESLRESERNLQGALPCLNYAAVQGLGHAVRLQGIPVRVVVWREVSHRVSHCPNELLHTKRA